MSETFSHYQNWEKYFNTAKRNLGPIKPHPLWQQAYAWQTTFTEIELRNLGVHSDIHPSKIPYVNSVQNRKQIDPINELGIIEVIGMPGGGKDTIINDISKQEFLNVLCALEEGYFWSKKESPLTELRSRHLQVYGGTDMEIDEVIDKLSFNRQQPNGIAVLNRSFTDNFWAFGYSFFLNGYIGLEDLLTSQKVFHHLQYSPTKLVGTKLKSIEDITAATFVLMIEPELSLERKKSKGTGRVLEKNFLQLLYIQYLRMISRLMAIKQRNLVVLDMSGTLTENISLFNQLFREVVKI